MKKINLLFICSIVFASLNNIFLFSSATGLITTLISLAALFMAIILIIREQKKIHIGLFISLLALAFTYIFRHQPELQILNFLIFIGLYIVFVVQSRDGFKLHLHPYYFTLIMEQLIYPLVLFKIPMKHTAKLLNITKIKTLSKEKKHVLIGIAITLPLLAIFTSLLASADDIFKDMVTINSDFFNELLNSNLFAKIVVWLLTFLYIFSFFYYAFLYDKRRISNYENTVNTKSFDTITTTLLIPINILFAVFVFIQIRYLFAGTIVNGMTYSSYARKGFFELTAISIMVMLLALVIRYYAHKKSTKGLLTLVCLQTLVIAYSAIFRLNLYTEAYGYTWLRVLSIGFICVQMIIIVLTLIWIYQPKLNIKLIALTCYFIGYLIVNYANIDAFIVEQNMNRYLKGEDLDMEYIQNLSADSVPTLIKYEEQFKNLNEHNVTYQRIKFILEQKNLNREEEKWLHFNLSQYQANTLLKNRKTAN